MHWSHQAGNADENLFGFAVANLNRLHEFGPQQILSQIVERLNQWVTSERPYGELSRRRPDRLTQVGEIYRLCPAAPRQVGLSPRVVGDDGI